MTSGLSTTRRPRTVGRLGSSRSVSLPGQALVLTLALALTMRLLVSILGLPGILNFAFFPVLLFGVLVSRPGRSKAELQVAKAIVLVTLAILASTLANFANPLAAALLWASLATPFLLVRLAVTTGRQPSSKLSLDRLLITFLFIQGAAIAFERVVLGQSGDAAQGFLRGQGAGHHIVGFIGVGTALYLGMRLLEEPAIRDRSSMYGAVLTGLAIGAITGTSQAFLAAAVVAVSYLLTRHAPWPMAASLVIGGALLAAVFVFWPAFTPPERNWYGSEFFANKGLTATRILREYQDFPHQIFFGLGPGATATKVAWTGAEGFNNLTATLGIEPGPVTQQLQDVERAKPVTRTSSLTSPWSTWMGVGGDLGLLGLSAYIWAWAAIARSTSGERTRRAGMYLVLYLVLLGVFYNWLEEPVLTIFLGLAVSAAVVRALQAKELTEVSMT